MAVFMRAVLRLFGASLARLAAAAPLVLLAPSRMLVIGGIMILCYALLLKAFDAAVELASRDVRKA